MVSWDLVYHWKSGGGTLAIWEASIPNLVPKPQWKCNRVLTCWHLGDLDTSLQRRKQVQAREVTCSRPHGSVIAELGLHPEFTCSQPRLGFSSSDSFLGVTDGRIPRFMRWNNHPVSGTWVQRLAPQPWAPYLVPQLGFPQGPHKNTNIFLLGELWGLNGALPMEQSVQCLDAEGTHSLGATIVVISKCPVLRGWETRFWLWCYTY